MNKLIFRIALVVSIPFLSCCESDDSPTPKPNPPVEKEADVEAIDNLVNDFMEKHDAPGLSLAISKNGKLVYARGYGFSDKENQEEVNTTTLFRVASVSKPITGIAVMKLVEEGEISLDDKVFGPEGILSTDYGTLPYGNGITGITLEHLLQHTAGGWQNDGTDPMFLNPAMNAEELLTWTLDNRSLQNTPGTSYAYSNFGYSILGRVIEKVTGQPYEVYVKNSILEPIGIIKMQIGGNTKADRKPDEVVYYPQNGENPYAFNIVRMDAHGGWVASATDLVRLLVHVDGFASVPDMLSPQSIETMTTGSSANPNYALGWSVNNSDNWWHVGSLPGTVSEIVRTSSGYTWAILTNTRSSDPNFINDLDMMLWNALATPGIQWPEEDLF